MKVDAKVTRKELTGRSSAASSVAVPNHKAGAVPKYLKVIYCDRHVIGFPIYARQKSRGNSLNCM